MNDIKEESKLLASLAVFRELYDQKKDIYGVIAEFLSEVIASFRKFQFNLTEITNLLNNTFDFTLPEAVVGTALNRLDLRRDHGYYFVNNMQKMDGQRLNTLQEKTLSSNNIVIDSLFSFIESEKEIVLPDFEKIKIVRAFCSFLLDDSTVTEYSEYISGFTIKNKENENFTKNLNKIREGVILYSGIKYSSNLSDLGSWKTSLTIYLDTEILFHFVGYNGKLYQSLFEVFCGYVKEINGKAKKNLIKLEYFREVKYEIEDFFTKAKDIVDGKDILEPKNTAMASVIEGCKSPSDVLAKKSDFYLNIKNNGITESTLTDYYDEPNHQYNIVDKRIIKSISEEFDFDITENLKFLNFISILRKEANSNNFDNIRCILLTGNLRTIRVARHEQIKPEGVVPLATTLNWITNRFWFKLHKGFGDGNFPISFDVITKAQMVLSSILNKSISEQYGELLTQFKEGKISEEKIKARYIDLRSQIRKPEEIERDDISPILDALSEDSLEHFIKEQELSKHDAFLRSEENKKLKKELSDKDKALEMEASARIMAQNEVTRKSKKELIEKKESISILKYQMEPIEKMALQDFVKFKKVIGTVLAFSCLIICYLIWKFGWGLFDHIVSLTSLLPPVLLILYLLFFDKELTWNPKLFLERKKEQYKQKRYQQFHFDINQFDKLNKEVDRLENEINNKKK